MKKLILLVLLFTCFKVSAQTYNGTTWSVGQYINSPDTSRRASLGGSLGLNYGPFFGNAFTYPNVLRGTFNVSSPFSVLTLAPKMTATADGSIEILTINPTIIPAGHQFTTTGIDNYFNLLQRGSAFFSGAVNLNAINTNFFSSIPNYYNITIGDSLRNPYMSFIQPRQATLGELVINGTQPTHNDGFSLHLKSGSAALDGGFRLNGIPTTGSSAGVLNVDGSGNVFRGSGGGGGTVTAVTGSGNIASSGGTTPNITFTGILPVANGGTSTATPGIVAGTNVTVTGTWPNQTVNSTASGGATYVGSITPTGAINSSNNTFTLPFTPVTGTVTLFYNGQALIPTTDYTISGATVTTTSPPFTGSNLTATLAH